MVPVRTNINKNFVVILILVLVVGTIVFYQLKRRNPASVLFEVKEVELTNLPTIPTAEDVDLSVFTAERVSIYVEVKGKKLSIYSLQTLPKSSPKGTVLLLHGLGDSAHNWVQINTMHLLGHWGYKAIAIDLPGYGRSADMELGTIPREDFMVELVKVLGGELPIIVAPSMAGSFAIPYLFQTPDVGVERAAGFVAISPVASDSFVENYSESQLPTLILYGERDERLGAFSRQKLQALPRSHIIVIPDAGHACFKEQPDLFHRALYHYLTYLKG